jgi:deoxyribose-phosphate aldolase
MKHILSKVDHTLLSQGATWEEIKVLCDDAVKFGTASVCVAPSFVKRCAEYLKDKDVLVCTVIGFPNGYATTETKVFETKNAIDNGADEIDMVINIGDVKMGDYDKILDEIKEIKAACGDKTLKVIIETCLLTDEEKVEMCRVVSKSGADFIKTSTGFSTGGATFDDIKLFAENVEKHVKIKAAGGISSIDDAEKFISLGADRLGTSRIVKILKNSDNGGY